MGARFSCLPAAAVNDADAVGETDARRSAICERMISPERDGCDGRPDADALGRLAENGPIETGAALDRVLVNSNIYVNNGSVFAYFE